jgi:hypothetical protein
VEKPKRDPVVPEMRHRLIANRDGRMTPGQWGEMISQPLVVLVLLTGFALAAFGPRLLPLLRFWWIVVPLLLGLVFLPAILRAFRYARAPIHFAKLTAGAQPLTLFRKSMLFYTGADEAIRFGKSLAPRLPLQTDVEYLVYYLEDGQGKVLLSAAPAEHPDAEYWLPTKQFQVRFDRRRSQS